MKRRISLSIVLAIVALGVVLLYRYKSAPVSLPFESIWHDIGGINYRVQAPGIIVIVDAQQLDEVSKQFAFTPELMDRLRAVDFQSHFVIAALQGLQGSSGFHIAVQRVVRSGRNVTVYAEMTTLKPGEGGLAVLTSPSEFVQVPRDRELSGNVSFVLHDQVSVVAQTNVRFAPN